MKTTTLFSPLISRFYIFLAIGYVLCLGSDVYAQTGPNFAGQVVNDASAGNLAWINASDASGNADDDIWAFTPTMATNDQSNYLKATDFGFSIPAFHVIDGVEVQIEWHRTGANIRDIEVLLVVGGVIQTIQNNASNTRIPNGPPDGVETYGGATDVWGLTLTDTDVEDIGFGVAVRVRRQGSGGGAPPHQPMVDRISITVYHKLDDKDPTNELNTNLTLSGTTLELTDAGGTLSQDLSTLNDALQAEVDQNKLDISANSTAITANDADIASLQSDVSTNTTDIANNTAAIGTNSTDIANNTTAITANDADIASLQSDVSSNTTDIANNTTAIATNSTDIANNTAAIIANDADIVALQSDVSSNTTDIATNTTDIANNTAAIIANDVDIASLQSDVSTNTTDIANNTTAVAGNSTNITNNTAAITANDADIASLQSDVSTNTTDIANNTTAITSNSTNITNNTAAITANDADIASLQSDVSTNTTDIANNTTAITSNSTNIAYLTSTIGANIIDIANNTTAIAANAASIATDTDGSPSNELNTSLILNGSDLELTDAGGLLSVDLSNLSISSVQDKIADADGNTRIQVEANPNEDIIRFDVGGTERWIMTGNRLEPSDIWNTFIGHQAGSSNTTGQQNTFLGKEAGRDNTTGETNVFLGEQAGKSNTSGWANTITGKDAGTFISTGHRNAYYGYGSGALNTSGADNTMIGYLAGVNSTGSRNVFVGNQAGHNETGDDKLYIDNSATSTPLVWGDFASDILRVHGTFNINNAYSFPLSDGTVDQVLSTNGAGNLTWKTIDPATIQDADNDTKIQLEESTDEDIIRFDLEGTERWVMLGSRLESRNNQQSIFIGENTGVATTSGHSNTFIGSSAGGNNTTGFANVSLGNEAGFSINYGVNNTFLGTAAGHESVSGQGNTLIGSQSGYSNVNGIGNTFVGNRTGSNSSGSQNVFLGYEAGFYETGDNKLYIANNNTSTPLIWGDFASNLLKIYGTLNVNDAYNFPLADGSVGQVLASDGAGNLDWQTTELGAINDADNDTKIHVEKNTDEDIIRFDLGGVERWQMQGTRLIPINSWKSTFVGAASGKNDVGNTNNTFFGYETGFMNTSGADNTFVGREAGRNNDVGTYNVFVGSRAGISNVTANENTYLGYGAGALSTDGFENTAVGFLAGNQNLTGIRNTIIGNEAGYLNTGSSNVFLGYQAGYNEASSDKLYIDNSSTSTPLIWGDFSLDLLQVNGSLNINNAYNFPNTDGTANQFLVTDGAGNTSWQTLNVEDADSDPSNEFLTGASLIGTNLEISDAGGTHVVDLITLTAGGNSSAIFDTDGDTRIQTEANPNEDIIRFDLANTERWKMLDSRIESVNSGGSIFIGEDAGNSDDLSANTNVFIGHLAGQASISGENNVFLGHYSGYNSISSFNNTSIGFLAGTSFIGGHNNTSLGYGANAGVGFDVSNSTAVGTNAQNTATFQIRIGHAAITSIGGFANWSNLSDARLKKDIQDSGIGLDFIMKLRPVSYHLDMDAIHTGLNIPESQRHLDGEKAKGALLQTGFLAQEVEQAAKELGYDFSGVDAPKNDKDFYGLRYAEFVVPLVKGMQEQQEQIETLEQENADLRTRLASIEEALIRLEAGRTGSSEKFQRKPEHMILHQNVPNPFDRNTRISYELAQSGQVQLNIYTQQNALVETLVFTHQEAGEHTVEWNADRHAAGVYIYVLSQHGQQLAKRMIVLK
ncbi:MAG: tail fiber domain-containing protein [Bacteroidota bacterium]